MPQNVNFLNSDMPQVSHTSFFILYISASEPTAQTHVHGNLTKRRNPTFLKKFSPCIYALKK